MNYPNYPNKHESKALYTPTDFIEYMKAQNIFPEMETPVGAIICFQRRLVNYIEANEQMIDIQFFKGDCFLLKESYGNVLVVGNFGIGAPIAAIIMEELIAFGIKQFIIVGTAGTLQKHINIGDSIVCDRAIRDEGTSHHYLRESKYVESSTKLTENIISKFEEKKLEYKKGTSWTIDAPYCETIDEITHYQQEGVLTVEMEASALFAIAKHRNVDASAIFTVSDSLAELKWGPGFHQRNVLDGLIKAYHIAKESFMPS